jgi:hypothetical protein
MEEVGTLRSLGDTAGRGANEIVLRFTPVLD